MITYVDTKKKLKYLIIYFIHFLIIVFRPASILCVLHLSANQAFGGFIWSFNFHRHIVD